MTNIELVRFYIGDTDSSYLDDAVIQYLLDEHGNSPLDAAIEALEAIINEIALQPRSASVDGIRTERASVASLEARLDELKTKKNARKGIMPILLHTKRQDWNDITRIFE